MVRKILLLTFLFVGLQVAESYAQAAKATMRVSVNVVKGRSVETVNPGNVRLSESYGSELGSIKLKGIALENTLINTSENIVLRDPDGNEIKLDVIKDLKQSTSSSSNLSLLGFSRGELKEGSYSGELSTTIEYL